MNLKKLILRNVFFFWRTNIAIVLGVATAVAVLSGALLTGESVRESLRRLLYERIGSTEYAVVSEGFFDENLGSELSSNAAACPIIYLKGIVVHEQSGVPAHEVNVYGIDERFWKFHGATDRASPQNRSALLGSPLARQLGAAVGDTLLLRVERQNAIPGEWLYGRRENTVRTIRLNCSEILPEQRLGEFALRPSQGNILSIFVPIRRLQRDLEQNGRVNAVLISGPRAGGLKALESDLKQHCTLRDLGLKLRDIPGKGLSLESNRIILNDQVAEAASQAASVTGMKASPIYTYLANSIRVKEREIPYSVITAADKDAIRSAGTVEPSKESITLTDWAARDLGASPGDPVEVDYYLWQESGELSTRTAEFELADVVPISGDVNATLAPEIPGITEARSINEWDPPFPLDYSRIRREDEDFWNRYKATPKAFISLARGQELWHSRFGKVTAVRLIVPEGMDLKSAQQEFSAALLDRLDPQSSGFVITAVRDQGLAASYGSTDFGEYFVYFSSFLIFAALLLSALFFKLMVEQRVKEIGILRAAGLSIRTLQRIFAVEALLLSVAGSILGLLGAILYGWLMVTGLRTLWIGAVGTDRLYLHISWMHLALGAVAGILFSTAAIIWTLRSLRRNSPRMLLTGTLESFQVHQRRVRTLKVLAIISFTAAFVLLGTSLSGGIPRLESFFAAALLLLVAILCSTAIFLRRKRTDPIRGGGWIPFFRLAVRNAMHRPGRSLICISLIASATFIIISMEAFRRDPGGISLETTSGTGGFPLLAYSALPIVHNLNSPAGRDALGIADARGGDLDSVRFVSFRERSGDDASCLNLYAPQEPSILGVPHEFVAAGRFGFQKTMAQGQMHKDNPWLLLESPLGEGVIAAAADATTIRYILHLSLGDELTVRGSNGKPVRLRLVAALRDSIFQGRILISESDFLRYFPDREGYQFFLLDLPHDRSAALAKTLREQLSDWGFNPELSQERLAAYHRVENTYLSTFQSLGALGLILGTLGLATVLLRNVLERRQEIALLRAIGYRQRILSGLILTENVFLILWGLFSGAACAFLSIIPALDMRGASLPFQFSGLVLLAVLSAGLLSSFFAVVAAFRSPLLATLRSE